MSGPSASRRGRRAVVGGLLVVVLAPLAAGCGSSGPSTTTSSGSTQKGAKNAITTAFEYSRCMRSHGVSNFPDPKVVNSPGHQAISLQVNPSETGSPNFKTASQACQGILPAPQNLAAQQQAHKQDLLAFAQCVRAKGIAGFPDPGVDGQLTLEMVKAAGIDVQAPKVQDVAKACVPASHGVLSIADVERAASGGQ
jgi:hypothetical protein